jgi:hypothetical protein
MGKENDERKDLLPKQVERDGELASIDKNIAHISSTIENVANNAFKSWSEHLEFKAKHAEQELKVSDRQHKRTTILLFITIAFVFSLLVMAMYKEQYELVKIILGSALAVAAGAGLTSLLPKKSGK